MSDNDDWSDDHEHNQNIEVKNEDGEVVGHLCSSCGAST